MGESGGRCTVYESGALMWAKRVKGSHASLRWGLDGAEATDSGSVPERLHNSTQVHTVRSGLHRRVCWLREDLTGHLRCRPDRRARQPIFHRRAQREGHSGWGDRSFDRLVFVEKDPGRCAALRRLRDRHADRTIDIIEEDANCFPSPVSGASNTGTGGASCSSIHSVSS